MLACMSRPNPKHKNKTPRCYLCLAPPGAPYDVVLSGARIDGTLDAEGDFKLERLMAAARPLGSRAAPAQSLSAPTAAAGAGATRWPSIRLHFLSCVSGNHDVADPQHGGRACSVLTSASSAAVSEVSSHCWSSASAAVRSRQCSVVSGKQPANRVAN